MTIRKAYLDAVQRLKNAGNESPEFDAAQLLEAVTGVSRMRLPLEGMREISEEALERLETLTTRRSENYPLQYLLGEWEFYGLPFVVGEGVLIPRADTETLVETGLHLLEGIVKPVVYDLCSGSGCIAAAIASQRPDASVYAVELSEKALPFLTKNVEAFPNVKVIRGDVLEVMEQLPPCHLILSNPPYLSDEEMTQLQAEVTYEPAMALRADHEGLYFYEEITKRYQQNLLPGGAIAYEVGYTQSAAVASIMEHAGMKDISVHKDLNGIERVVAAKK
jgi:release factor glutamine methyltransferase